VPTPTWDSNSSSNREELSTTRMRIMVTKVFVLPSLLPQNVLTSAGLDFIEKKSGHTMGRDTNEKITDGARGLYEKATGYVLFPTLSHSRSGEQAT
jgi:hypothetical protein